MSPVIETSMLAREIAQERVKVKREPMVLEMRARTLQRTIKAVRSAAWKIENLLTGSPSPQAAGASNMDV